jgi:hypothetical protein
LDGIAIPIAAALAEAINAAAPSQHVVLLLNERGEAFTARGFSKWFAKQCQRIGLNGLSAHGLREAACRRLAEADARPTRSPPSAATPVSTRSPLYPRGRSGAHGPQGDGADSNLVAESGKPGEKKPMKCGFLDERGKSSMLTTHSAASSFAPLSRRECLATGRKRIRTGSENQSAGRWRG